MLEGDFFQKYDLLLPSKYEGGYLIIALFHKIQNKELGETFTVNDIRVILEDIAKESGQPVAQSERLIRNLLHYILRSIPDEYGVYCLSEHAKRLVKLISNKIDNPYKNYPLKESFDKYFTTRFKEIKSITDLELRFGSDFVAGHKGIINDHLEALEEELNRAYGQLNQILHSDEHDATVLVKRFVKIFKTFGERAEDISNAIASKDRFLRTLRIKVDDFYNKISIYKNPQNEEEKQEFFAYQNDWKRSLVILKDMEGFFQGVDYKIDNIRKQILSASDKLTELHENFAAQSSLRVLIKRLLLFSLTKASFDKDGILLESDFPIKELVHERVQLFFPEHYEFDMPQQNTLIEIVKDSEYEGEQRAAIEMEIKQQEIVNYWVAKTKNKLLEKEVNLNDLIDEIIEIEKDLMVALYAAVELVQHVSENEGYGLEISQKPLRLKTEEMQLWKTRLLNKEPITAS